MNTGDTIRYGIGAVVGRTNEIGMRRDTDARQKEDTMEHAIDK